MPLHGHDYDSARGQFIKGKNLKQISVELGIPYAALAKTASRKHWDKLRVQTGQAVSFAVQEGIQTAATLWLSKINTKVNDTLEELCAYDFASKVHKMDAESYIRSLDTLDRIARRTLGLDNDSSPKTVTLSVNVNSGTREPLGSVIDIPSLPITTDTGVTTSDGNTAPNLPE